MKKLLFISISILLCLTNQAQIITTVAGGGGDNIPAIKSPINKPTWVAIDFLGNLFIADRNNNKIRKVNVTTGIISTIAGNGSNGFKGDGDSANTSLLRSPTGLAFDGSGNLYIADQKNYRIRKLNISTGLISTIAGIGIFGTFADGNLATSSYLNSPSSVAVDKAGNLYIADKSNHRIRKVNSNTGIISTVAGEGTSGYFGDGFSATNASLSNPTGIAIDDSGNIYIADQGNNKIRKVTISTGIISTIAGDGTPGFGGDGSLATTAYLNSPFSVALDATNNIYVADAKNNRIRKINATTGIISTIAGNGIYDFGGDGLLATSASLAIPQGLMFDSLGNLFFADSDNNRIRKINANTGIISTVAGNGTTGFGGDGSLAVTANLCYPFDIAFDRSGNSYIADYSNHRIRKINANTGIISTIAGIGDIDGAISIKDSTGYVNFPNSIAVDSLDNIYFVDPVYNLVNKLNGKTGAITKFVGNKTSVYNGDGIPASNAGLYEPTDVCIDKFGNLFIADKKNNRIRKVTISTGIISTVAGNGIYGYEGDGGLATLAKLASPISVAVDGLGNLYIAEYNNHTIRKVNASTGIISTIVGNGTNGYIGDGGLATLAKLALPISVAVDRLGNLYISDFNNKRIRKVNSVTGIITTIAGDGKDGYEGDGAAAINASFFYLVGIAIDESGNLNIADANNNRIRKIWNNIYNNSIFGNQNICSGSDADSIIGYTPMLNKNSYSYRWLKSTTSANSGFSAIPLSNTKNYKPLAPAQTTWYKRCVITDSVVDTSKSVLITVKLKPVANFSINNDSQCLIGNSFSFTNYSTNSNSQIWSFGDSSNSSILNPIKAYNTAGNFVVKLVAKNNSDCNNDSITKNVTIFAQPKASFIINKDSQCVNNNFIFTDTTSNTISIWNTGIGNYQTTKVANQSYSIAGKYTILLTVKSDNNCTDSTNKTIYVLPKLTIGNILGNINPTSSINPYTYSVLNQVNSIYNWTATNGTIQNGQGTNAVSVVWASKGAGSVNAKITNANNCTDTTNLAVNITTVGVNDFAIYNFSQIQIKPNPFSTNLEISFISVTKETTKLIITDAIGKEVYVQNFPTNIGDNNIITEDLSTLKPGFYMATLANNNGQSKAFKVLKN